MFSARTTRVLETSDMAKQIVSVHLWLVWCLLDRSFTCIDCFLHCPLSHHVSLSTSWSAEFTGAYNPICLLFILHAFCNPFS